MFRRVQFPGVWFSYDVSASLWPAVATVRIGPDVEASLSLSVAAATIRVCPDVAASLSLLSQQCWVSFLASSGFVKFPVVRDIRFLGRTSGIVYCRQRDDDTSADERTNDGTDDDLNDGANDGASVRRRSQLHACAQHVAHI